MFPIANFSYALSTSVHHCWTVSFDRVAGIGCKAHWTTSTGIPCSWFCAATFASAHCRWQTSKPFSQALGPSALLAALAHTNNPTACGGGFACSGIELRFIEFSRALPGESGDMCDTISFLFSPPPLMLVIFFPFERVNSSSTDTHTAPNHAKRLHGPVMVEPFDEHTQLREE